ncbi:MAG: hypothetical protein IPL52_15475 [Flavobacteriales bacterium]|nr:hypothetical protein [Flavobacteriales bacterium]
MPSIILLLLAWAYLIKRALGVSFSWDEAYSYLHHVKPLVLWPQAFDSMGANHHLLNVWGMCLSAALFGNGELALRLPNLLFFGVYAGAVLVLVRHATNVFHALFLTALLVLHPYMLDFFALARGYGIGLGATMLALVLAWNYVRTRSLRDLVCAMAAAGVAAMANFIFVNFLFALGGALVILQFMLGSDGRTVRRNAAMVVSVAVPFLAVVLPIAVRMSDEGAFYFGNSDPWQGSVRGLAIKVFYHLPHYSNAFLLFQRALLVAVAAVVLSLVVSILRRKLHSYAPVLPGLLVLLLWCLGLFVEHRLNGTPYPETRTAMPFVPLGCFIVSSAMMNTALGRWFPTCLLALLICPLGLHQYRASNYAYTVEWRASGEVRSMVQAMLADSPPTSSQRPLLTVSSDFESREPFAYYLERYGLQRFRLSAIRIGNRCCGATTILLNTMVRGRWIRLTGPCCMMVRPRTPSCIAMSGTSEAGVHWPSIQ